MTLFDRFAQTASAFVARAPFFLACCLLVVIWLPSYFITRDVNTWQLVINTITTIVTFLLVALLQNTSARADAALQQKLNAVARVLAATSLLLYEQQAELQPELVQAVDELRRAIGLEDRTST